MHLSSFDSGSQLSQEVPGMVIYTDLGSWLATFEASYAKTFRLVALTADGFVTGSPIFGRPGSIPPRRPWYGRKPNTRIGWISSRSFRPYPGRWEISFTDLFVDLEAGAFFVHRSAFTIDTRNVGNGLDMLRELADGTASLAFFDPQTRAVLDHQRYGNEGRGRGKKRVELRQQGIEEIAAFGLEYRRVLRPSAYLARWCTPFEVGKGLFHVEGMQVVAIQVWDSGRPSYPQRIAYSGGFLVFLQKPPVGIKARGLQVQWLKALPGVYRETVRFPRSSLTHVHRKPIGLTAEAIMAITRPGDTVIDACAGSYVVLAAALGTGRHCWSTDIAPWPPQGRPQ
jgi:hypothetical protein